MKENRSFFWPLTLIATGILWLLISMGRIPSENLWSLAHLWPYLLIALGVGLILRGLWRPLGAVVSALVVLGAVGAVLYAPQLGWNDMPNWGWWSADNQFTGGIPGSGKIETETRSPQDFDSISIRYPGEIVIRQGEESSISIKADDNLLPQLTTKVEGGTLVIENSESRYLKRVDPSETVKITITVTDLKEINFSSAGTLDVIGLDVDELELKLSGAGDATLSKLNVKFLSAVLSGAGKITLDGNAQELKVIISGLGNFEGAHLQTATADVLISGAGNATLRVQEELTARVSGAGSVNYYGSPNVNQNISGAGAVKKMGE